MTGSPDILRSSPPAHAADRGLLVANVLRGAWRPAAPAPDADLSPEALQVITPQLLRSGSAALAWWKIRNSDLARSPAGKELEQAWRWHALRAVLHAQEVERLVVLLQAHDIEPIVVKGWAIARHYPDEALRPYGDVDLCVAPEQYGTAAAVLAGASDAARLGVDLHEGFTKLLPGERFSVLQARSERARLATATIRVLAPEDHLRLLCFHFLRHGAWRPLWLCDIAMALETRSESFDWSRALGPNRRVADYVACALALGNRLLGLRIADTPAAYRAGSLPRWLLQTVLYEWGTFDTGVLPLAASSRYRPRMVTFLRSPRGLVTALRQRWPPNPIEATISTGGQINEFPRMPYQIRFGLLCAWRFTRTLPAQRRLNCRT